MKKCKLTFKDVSEADHSKIEEILQEAGVQLDYRPFLLENVKFVLIKDQICGFILKNHIVIKHLVLKPMFQDQGLSKELVESYYFI